MEFAERGVKGEGVRAAVVIYITGEQGRVRAANNARGANAVWAKGMNNIRSMRMSEEEYAETKERTAADRAEETGVCCADCAMQVQECRACRVIVTPMEERGGW